MVGARVRQRERGIGGKTKAQTQRTPASVRVSYRYVRARICYAGCRMYHVSYVFVLSTTFRLFAMSECLLLLLLLVMTTMLWSPSDHTSKIQVVGNAYTAADVHRPTAAAAAAGGAGKGGSSDDGHDVWIEVGLRARAKDVRMRCVFQYEPKGGESEEGGSGEEGGKGVEAPSASASGSPGSMAIRRVFLVREGLDRLPLQDAAMEVMREWECFFLLF